MGGIITTEPSTHQEKLYMPYELHHEIQKTATSPDITITGKKPHADIIARTGYKLSFTRVYINNKRATVTEVALSGANTVISVSDTIISGDTVEIFFAPTTGTLGNNTTTGKFPYAKLQVAQKYSVKSNVSKQSGYKSRIHRITYASAGAATLAFIRHGIDNMKNFTLAAKNDAYLMFIIKDTTDAANTMYEVLHEVKVQNCTRGTQANNAKGSEIVDVITVTFVPGVSITIPPFQTATSFDDTRLSGTPVIIKVQGPDGKYYFTKVYPDADATVNEVADPIAGDAMGINDATLSGVPLIFEITSGATKYYLPAYPTISSEVVAHVGILLYPLGFLATTISGTPRIIAIPINGTAHYTKVYSNRQA